MIDFLSSMGPGQDPLEELINNAHLRLNEKFKEFQDEIREAYPHLTFTFPEKVIEVKGELTGFNTSVGIGDGVTDEEIEEIMKLIHSFMKGFEAGLYFLLGEHGVSMMNIKKLDDDDK